MGKTKKETKPLSEISVEMCSVQSAASTGGYRDAIDSEHDFEIGHHEDFNEAVSDITTITRAIDEGPQQPKRSRRGMLLPCLFFAVCIMAVVLVHGRGGGSNMGNNLSSTVIISDGYFDGETNTDMTIETGQGKIVEFTIANLNTNANNCTHIKDTHVLQCIPSHNNATNKFRIKLHPEWAPIGVDRFEDLTTSNFWHDVAIFRIVPNFISQFGISSYPEVQKNWTYMGPIQDDPVSVSNNRGTVTFATAGDNSRTLRLQTQIFINTSDNWYLDEQGFAPIGEVLPAGVGYGGMEVIAHIILLNRPSMLRARYIDEFYAGYGQEPSQTKIRQEGEAYLKEKFPLLSYVVKAEFVDQDEIFHV
ncbi:hypothetical protein ACHAXR_004289 [Thalassiosira sp. AJA248-18]